MSKALLTYLEEYLTDNKKELIQEILDKRTRHLTIVLEDIYQSQNASAVLRSCECIGIQDVHIIENINEYTLNRDVVRGSAKWLDLYHYKAEENNTQFAINSLKEKGYKIIATTPHERSSTIEKLDLNDKTAIVFGTEGEGISQQVMDMADGFVKIPMVGFTESYNISVAAALTMYTLKRRLEDLGSNWHLSEEEVLDLKLKWAKSIIKRSDLIVNRFHETEGK